MYNSEVVFLLGPTKSQKVQNIKKFDEKILTHNAPNGIRRICNYIQSGVNYLISL